MKRPTFSAGRSCQRWNFVTPAHHYSCRKANFGKESKPEPVIAKISQETLAEMVGTTRSRVSMFMNKFRKLGFIEYNGSLEVHNSLLNVVLHDNPDLRKREEKAK
jgi:hypothetical protein